MMQHNYLLNSDLAIRLYERIKELPIIDYHNHLCLEEIRENKRYSNIYDLWLKPDPYKHRAMRMCGVDEKYISGDASDEEKFIKWWEVLPSLVLNPLYFWAAMEIETVFGISVAFDGKDGKGKYRFFNDYLSKNEITVEYLTKLFKVEYLSPCVSLTDDIDVFAEKDDYAPSLRGDDIVVPDGICAEKLGKACGIKILEIDDYFAAIENRIAAFINAGCKFSDHAIDDGFEYFEDDGNNGARFRKALAGDISEEDRRKLSCYILTVLAGVYEKHGIVMQLHIGAQRYTSSRLRKVAGAAGGFAGIGNSVRVKSLVGFLDAVEKKFGSLPKIILFTLNPSDNALISTLSGSFAKNGVKGLITQGPAWWWCDHKHGIEDMLENFSAFSVLSNFVGMTTDSRSFLSFVRHDYFRRVLCDWLAGKFQKGEILCGENELQSLVCKLCYENAREIIL